MKPSEQYPRPDKNVLRERLTDLQYMVTQHDATEPPFRNAYYDEHRPGIYVDVTTGQPLFLSTDKFDSGCGWPAFARPIESDAVVYRSDHKLARERTEVRSSGGDAHLGTYSTTAPPRSAASDTA